MPYNAASLPIPDFRALFEAIPGLYLVLLPDAPDFTIVAASGAYLRATLTEREAILGRRLFDVFPDNPKDPDTTAVRNITASLLHVLQQRAPHTMPVQKHDIRLPDADGAFEERYWSPINSPVFGAGGEVAYILHQVEDVTERIRLEQRSQGEWQSARDLHAQVERHSEEIQTLRESEILYRTLGEAVPDFIWACKANGEAIYVNRRWMDYTGLTLENASDLPSDVLHHPEDFPALQECWRTADATGEPYETEFRYRRHDGTYRWFMARAVPAKDAQGRILQWIGTSTDIHERKMAEQALRENEEQFRATFEQAAVGIAHVGLNGQWLRVNRKLCEIVGYSRDELVTCSFQDITHPDDLAADYAQLLQMLAGEITTYTMEKRYIRKGGALVWINLTVSLVHHPSGEPHYFISVVEDITGRKRLEEQLLEAQKLESVGRLAGGIAHDFNNLLTAILGYGELIEDEFVLEPRAQDYLHNMTLAAEKAAHLTGQMLAFARRQVIAPKVVDLNGLILSLDKMLRRLIGEHIELVILPEEGLHAVRVDPGQFEQILINLVVNARDAMPDGGKITIETHNATLDADYVRLHEGVAPGTYAVLAVSDTGTGIEEANRLHIFEPFFTTKEKGRGTGLGLATVYGIVKQAGGHIWLYSEPGQGTTFKIYLPRTTAPAELSTAPTLPAPPGGVETILVVEDEPAVRALAVQVLRGRGYQVQEAINGEEALRLVKGREREIALLITDVIMPQMNGKELADRLQSIHPDLKILYASGYTENTIVHHGVLEPGVTFLSKPYTPTVLARKVREILDNSATA